MAKFRLNNIELKELISRYESELRVLEFKVQKVKQIIGELYDQSDDSPRRKAIKANSETTVTPKKRGRKPGSKNKKKRKARQPRLSDWDSFVINQLQSTGAVLLSSEMVDIAKEQMPEVSEEEIKVKINRTLQKLANRHKLINKFRHAGRGFTYALNDWVGGDGLLLDEFKKQ